ncbi:MULTISPECIES: GNAT family N-acetyltransferase [unclassified Stenotrophomonas]|uniref:GNAT family N-acetyltransferase n=1 Tax=unclassified Stenotrophomonas TaxID=196198 RepID=UPI002117A472
MSTLRLFATPDASACLEIFDSNVPYYFGAHERRDFSNYLLQRERAQDYLVVERAGRIAACGGLMRTDEDTAAFCWGMVDSSLHRQGLGNILALARVARARALGVRRLTLSTSQHTRGFYAAQGFIVTAIVPDGHGPGLDAVHMERPLAPR